jgi:hypothetical protein
MFTTGTRPRGPLTSQLLKSFCVHNARLQPPAARNVRIGRDASIEGAPTVGCEPWLGCVSPGDCLVTNNLFASTPTVASTWP